MTHHTTPKAANLAAAAVVLSLSAATIASAQPCDFSAVDARAQQMLDSFALLPGVGVLVGDRRGVIHEAYFGEYSPATKVALASASKLISATAIMTLVDGGELDKDAPISTILPEFAVPIAGPVKSTITIDQMYSMTSGLPGNDSQALLGNQNITNDQAVAQIACCVALESLPGTDLRYGGYGMHVTGVAAERASGLEFDAFFRQAVSIPLGTPSISWDGLGETANFRPSGGGAARMRDYGKVLQLLLRRGELDGTRLLSPAAVNSMFVERTVGLPTNAAPPEAIDNGFGYAFGMWVEERRPDGTPTVLTSPGAFGFTPVLDLADDYWAIIMVEGSRSVLLDDLNAIRDTIDRAVRRNCRTCLADYDEDQRLNIDDVLIFLGAFSQGLNAADFNASGNLDIDDVLAFLDAFAAGC